MKAVIFTEAGRNFGFGHLSRCVALKDYLSDFSVKIYNRGDYASQNATNCDWMQNFDALIDDAQLVVIDSYYAPPEFYGRKTCIALDDFSRISYPKECIILNPALNSKRLYIDVKNPLFAGVEYGLLRREFRTREPKTIKREIERVLITLGGNDRQNNTQKVLDIIQKELSYAKIHIVLPTYHEPLECGFETQIHTDLSARKLKDLMLESDLVICGGGVTAVEVQSTRTPSIALEIAPNQSYQLRAWQKIGLRIAKNPFALKSLIKSLVKLKDRNKVHNALSKITIGADLPKLIEFAKQRI